MMWSCDSATTYMVIDADARTSGRQQRVKDLDTPSNSEKPTYVSLPYSILRVYKKSCSQTAEQAIYSSKQSDVQLFEGHLQFSSAYARKMFESVVSDIIQHVWTLLSKPRLKNIQYIFMAGSLASVRCFTTQWCGRLKGVAECLSPRSRSCLW